MSEAFSTEISDSEALLQADRICKHMNEDHASAIALYAQVFGNSPDTEAALMQSIDAQGMNLLAEIKGASVPVRIEFDHQLKDAEDAHHTLIDMVKQARTQTKT